MRTVLVLVAILLFKPIKGESFHLNTDPKFGISYLGRTVSFFEEDGLVKARMHVEIEVEALSNINFDYQHVVFLDSYSRIEKAKRNKKKYAPSISDFVQDGIFYNDLKVAQFVVKVENSNKMILRYDKIFEDYKMLDLVFFHDFSSPVDFSEVTIEIPNWLNASVKEFNFDNYSIEKSQSKNDKTQTLHYTVKDLKMPDRFDSSPSRGKIFPHLMFILNSSNNAKTDQKLMAGLDDLYSWYYSLVSKVDNDQKVLKSYLDKIVNPNDSDIDKIKSIYYWIQDNIKYIAFEYGIMGFMPESCQDVVSQKYGDCKGMANLMKQMLIMSGFDARLCWLGTNDVAYSYDTPTVYADNHMICMVELNGDRIFLDGTQKYSGLHNFSQGIQGRQVLIENGEKFILDEIPSLGPENIVFENNVNLKLDGDVLSGNGNSHMTGNQVTNYLRTVNSQNDYDSEEILGFFLSFDPKNVVCEIDFDNHDFDRDQDVNFAYNIKLKNRVTDIGSEIYFNPEIRFDYSSFSLEEDRNVDFELGDKKNIVFETTIQKPTDFAVSYIPKDISYDSETATFDLSFEENEESIIYKKNITIKNSVLPLEEFEKWNLFIKQLSEFYNDQVILTKKQ